VRRPVASGQPHKQSGNDHPLTLRFSKANEARAIVARDAPRRKATLLPSRTPTPTCRSPRCDARRRARPNRTVGALLVRSPIAAPPCFRSPFSLSGNSSFFVATNLSPIVRFGRPPGLRVRLAALGHLADDRPTDETQPANRIHPSPRARPRNQSRLQCGVGRGKGYGMALSLSASAEQANRLRNRPRGPCCMLGGRYNKHDLAGGGVLTAERRHSPVCGPNSDPTSCSVNDPVQCERQGYRTRPGGKGVVRGQRPTVKTILLAQLIYSIRSDGSNGSEDLGAATRPCLRVPAPTPSQTVIQL
jgi:hypothetical protein